MKNLWVDAGNDPDFNKGDQHKIDGYFLAMFDSRTTLTQLQAIKAKGHTCGIYMVTNWPQFVGKSPTEIAAIVNSEFQRVLLSGLRVQFDMEEHDPEKIATVLEEWRKLQPKINTSWTMESFQGGWMSPSFVSRMLACKVRIVPQFYKGNMGAVDDPWGLLAEQVAQDMALRDLTRRGFPESLVTGFYDAATLPQGTPWDGFAFTQGRLP